MWLVLVGHVRFDPSAATGRPRAAMQKKGYSLTPMTVAPAGWSERADAGSMTSKKCHKDIQLGQWSMMFSDVYDWEPWELDKHDPSRPQHLDFFG